MAADAPERVRPHLPQTDEQNHNILLPVVCLEPYLHSPGLEGHYTVGRCWQCAAWCVCARARHGGGVRQVMCVEAIRMNLGGIKRRLAPWQAVWRSVARAVHEDEHPGALKRIHFTAGSEEGRRGSIPAWDGGRVIGPLHGR